MSIGITRDEYEQEIAEYEETIKDLRAQLRLFNPCGHTGFESQSCMKCGYPDPMRFIENLSNRLERIKNRLRTYENRALYTEQDCRNIVYDIGQIVFYDRK